jgi:hypothetical protein
MYTLNSTNLNDTVYQTETTHSAYQNKILVRTVYQWRREVSRVSKTIIIFLEKENNTRWTNICKLRTNGCCGMCIPTGRRSPLSHLAPIFSIYWQAYFSLILQSSHLSLYLLLSCKCDPCQDFGSHGSVMGSTAWLMQPFLFQSAVLVSGGFLLVLGFLISSIINRNKY